MEWGSRFTKNDCGKGWRWWKSGYEDASLQDDALFSLYLVLSSFIDGLPASILNVTSDLLNCHEVLHRVRPRHFWPRHHYKLQRMPNLTTYKAARYIHIYV